jgi:hypothetical protein
MDRRLILGLVIAAIVAALAVAAFGGVFGGAAATAAPSTSATAGAASSGAGSPTGSTPTGPVATPNGPAASCSTTNQLIAVRATAADTGFPIPVEWLGLGPGGGVFFTQSEVAPRIPIDPVGPASIIVALQYLDDSGDAYKLTGGSLNLAYDPATGRVSGSLDTGYGKNSNRATTDTVPSQFEGTYTRPSSAGAVGLLEGTITHPDREDYRFRVQMAEVIAVLTSDPACASPRPTDTL